jgi:energy-coupling factor transporter ATP-binding protein EcfA2
MNILIMGRPGSGKSTIAALLQGMLAGESLHLCEYAALEQMHYESADWWEPVTGGFRVMDYAIYPACLLRLEQMATARLAVFHASHLLLEIAHADYDAALSCFSPAFAASLHPLFVDAPLACCTARCTERAARGGHLIPQDILTGYYRVQTPPATVPCTVIDNSGEREALLAQVAAFAEGVAGERVREAQRDCCIEGLDTGVSMSKNRSM